MPLDEGRPAVWVGPAGGDGASDSLMTDVGSEPTGGLSAAEFVRANTRLAALPLLPELRLYLSDDAYSLWKRTQEYCNDELPPPFWAFAWPGGQALARYVLDNSDQVRERVVLDLASGSGLVAIAAARAGAAAVSACEIDSLALAAISLNAAANGVALTACARDVLDEYSVGSHVVLAGDVFYEEAMSCRVLRFLERADLEGTLVLVGDPGRAYLPRSRFKALATYEVPVSRAVEDCEVKSTTIWRLITRRRPETGNP